ncbi:Uma2 family endonuclease [Desulfosporosinus lacus]|uniref:Endonuclease, Uma2 family (Restriction endonuclease fold) n=1 Tax=Desulfosporosinus lacus DSM 15449 TaxID=1121420 RepID=A0A1M5ZI83_9FIRM|nr:Uma2 family endonuclease [Desulfosporosinus lacus]SHI24025.1 Endonuclease, Uma2 family (restriction endonuclease fold) [Desulfosporosinus lacus DSM 15449]
MPLSREDKKYTFADYLTYPEDERWEIIDGVQYLQASPTPVHQEVLTELVRQIANHLIGKPCKVYPAPFCVRLPLGSEKNEYEVKNIVEPDISIICGKSKIDDKGCNGAPDMIIEIISPSSIKMDRVVKFNKYEKAGVREYWIVEPDQKLVSVVVLQINQRYGRTEIYTEEDKIAVSIFPDLVIDLSEVFTSQ